MYTWKQVSTLIKNKNAPAQDALPIPEENLRSRGQELALEVDKVMKNINLNCLSFNLAEETASSTPDISWFKEPGYRKYDVVSRPTDRVNRLVGNMVSEHPSMNELYGVYSGKGGLHEVNYADCANFSKYTEAKQEFEM